ncbi:chloride channel protein [Vallitalea longa]|uniref:Chloride channel protein n=1 Tax=Vallitalea longa TaxID=2936439 RepID=A0A9W5YCM1_9FIRM|nr:VWA domain-containing protein [Vallitalea longa]GKX30125.1 chloride channel protein [Vallitalea longa]
MRLEFGRIWVLILYPLIVFLILMISKKYYNNKLKKNLITVIRCIVMLFLILALADISIVRTSKETSTIFLSDVSESMYKNKESIKDFIRNAVKDKEKDDSVASVVFGENSTLDVNLTKDFTSDVLVTDVNGSYTDIEQGILKSMALMPREKNKRIVILTDGKANKGNLNKLVQSIKDQNIEIKVKNIDSTVTNEVYVDNFHIPQKVNLGEQFQINMNIFSTVETNSKITVIADGEKVITDDVMLRKGSNNYVMNDIAKKMGFVDYELLIEPDIDELTVNNTYSAFTFVQSTPKILILNDDEKDALQIVKIAESIGLGHDTLNSVQAPINLENMLKYKSIIMCNVSADNLSDAFLDNIPSYVKNFGGGLVTIGGESSYALGGYYKTPLETVLPVNMDMSGIKNKPKMAMMLVIDKSGSMSGNNLRLAKEAAIRTVEVLEDDDQIGVIAFDDTPTNVVDIQTVDNRKSINESILNISEGGGTSILPSLQEAYNRLIESKAEIKHIILLTDGQAEQNGYDSLLRNMNDNRITLSTVGVGTGADIKLLSYLATAGKGRKYFTRSGSSIPRIFAKEAFMASRTYINNMTFTPIMNSYHSILSNIYDEGLPQLQGYVGTSPKDAATVILTSPVNDPILSVWQYGLGKTASWCSDLSGEWSASYNAWDKNNVFWQNIINYTIENYSEDAIEINSSYDNGKVEITLNSDVNDSLLDTVVQLKSPSNELLTVNLEPVRKGVYQGTFEPEEIGSYMIKGVQRHEDEIVATGLGGINIPYSEEYKITTNKSFNTFVEKVGGRYIQDSREVFTDIDNKVKTSRKITNGLLIVALIMWLIDIAFRRFNIVSKLQKIVLPLTNLSSRLRKGIDSKNKKVVNKINENKNETIIIEKDIKKDKINKKPLKKNHDKKSNLIDTSELLGNTKRKR